VKARKTGNSIILRCGKDSLDSLFIAIIIARLQAMATPEMMCKNEAYFKLGFLSKCIEMVIHYAIPGVEGKAGRREH